MNRSTSTPIARPATIDDVDELIRLRALMFDAMGVTSSEDWQAVAAARVRGGLATGDLLAAVVDAPASVGTLAASGLAAIFEQLPGPTNPTGLEARISSMSTDTVHRRQGMAAAILDRLLADLRDRGVRRVELHATPAARPLYESRGFGPRPGGDEMQLVSDPPPPPSGAARAGAQLFDSM